MKFYPEVVVKAPRPRCRENDRDHGHDFCHQSESVPYRWATKGDKTVSAHRDVSERKRPGVCVAYFLDAEVKAQGCHASFI